MSKVKKTTKKVPEKITQQSQWSFIRNCRHELSKLCPMCKLIERETNACLVAEKENAVRLRNIGFFTRAEMRYGLLMEWSRNQLSTLVKDNLFENFGEIILCSGFVNALNNLGNSKFEWLTDSTKLLQNRNKILECGEFAAIYIQCRVRGFLCRKRVIAHMLKRFEYFPSSKNRQEYFLDRLDGRKWFHTPILIRHERPASPRTIDRRLNSLEVARKNRNERNQKFISQTNIRFCQETIWKFFEQSIVDMRQMIILRDSILTIMKLISAKRREMGEKAVPHHSIRTQERIGQNKSRRSSKLESNTPTVKNNVDINKTSFPYWFTFSNPAVSTRQLYIALALQSAHLPLEEDSNSVIDPNEQKSIVSDNLLNERFQKFDDRIWECMECADADEMMTKISRCEEAFPALSSISQIAEDSHQIWNSKINNNAAFGQFSSKEKSKVLERDSEDQSFPVLPMQIQILPFHTSRKPSNIFRLFIIDGEIAFVSHWSCWTFYSEIWKLRNEIISSIESFGESTAFRRLVKSLMITSNTTINKCSLENENSSKFYSKYFEEMYNISPHPENSSKIPAETPTVHKCFSTLLPMEQFIFGSAPTFQSCPLTLGEYNIVESKYKFLKNMTSWKASKRYLVNGKRLMEEDVSGIAADAQITTAQIPTMPLPEELYGTSIFRLSNQAVPSSSITPLTKEKIEGFQGLSAYRQLLKREINMLNNDVGMTERIFSPQDNEYSQDIIHTSKVDKIYDMIVVDVHLSIEVDSTKQIISKSQNQVLPPLKSLNHKLSTQMSTNIKVEMHQLIGVFSTLNDRPPASIDTALFPWSSFSKSKFLIWNSERNQFIPLPSYQSLFSSSFHSLSSSESSPSTQSNWFPIQSESGIYQSKVTSRNGLQVTYRLLGQCPSREYIEANVPRKIRNWLGLKY